MSSETAWIEDLPTQRTTAHGAASSLEGGRPAPDREVCSGGGADFEADVEGGSGVGEPTHGDPVRAQAGEASHRWEVYSPGDFDAYCGSRAAKEADLRLQARGGHVVEEDDVRAEPQGQERLPMGLRLDEQADARMGAPETGYQGTELD